VDEQVDVVEGSPGIPAGASLAEQVLVLLLARVDPGEQDVESARVRADVGGSSFAPSSSTAFALTVEVNPPTTYPATPMPLIRTTASATPSSLSSCPTALGERS
jgi:hypothetical protein